MLNGAAAIYAVVGGLVLYSGIKGDSIADTVKAAISGNLGTASPTESIVINSATGTSSVAAGNTGAANNTAAANQALAKQLAIQMGHTDWTQGQAWADWVSLWNQESGWSITAANPTSDARGIAQNINGYGPDYLQGNATSQITWGINYISGRYGSPVLAWQHEVANNWY